ncbi:MAG: glycogen debranching enzyme family protein [Bacteroidaceae bacterium]|nr:glycogen debranching enzyme family protein [Bacteroidaceae bacterium]
MSYLRFDKTQMTNLQDSLYKELLITNESGAYCSTTLVGCNIRKYHGLLVVPVPNLDDENHVLLSSLDETVIQHGAEFNLGLHKYQGENYSPKGHKYIMSFEWDKVPTWIYRIGGVLLKKELVYRTDRFRLFVRYTLLEAHSPTTLRLKPFLAFRSVRQWTHENSVANTGYEPVENGIKMCMYEGYPELYMQTTAENEFHYQPDWYRGLDYPKERERGYESTEDLLVPGYFEMPIKKGESIIFTASLKEKSPKMYAKIMEDEIESLDRRDSFYHCLVNAAHQFHVQEGEEEYLLAGYPWFKARARDTFISLPGVTLAIGERDRFERYMKTAEKGLREFMNKQPLSVSIYEMEQPDTLLWATWCLQQYAKYTSRRECYEKYGNLLFEMINFVRNGKHNNLFVHENGLLYSCGRDRAVTWMNSTVNGHPIVPRSGYIVEFNALWYNALKFAEQMLSELGSAEHEAFAKLLGQEADKVGASFKEVFLNEHGYLLDYVDGQMMDWSVRPNQLFAIALDFSPLDVKERKRVLDICTKELVTPKGIRSLSPKSGGYNPMYIGQQTQRDYAYHQGTAWPWLTGFYLEAYLRVYKMSGVNYIERQLIGFEEELFYHCVGTIPELFDGNPRFSGRGAISFAMNVSGILRAIRLLEKYRMDED